ncbi:copper resistance protein CopC [Streptomyces sp. NPDC048566]|uniref:copper resistance CopC family protein n=1 Tax=Streptomyces sp. NPDC048566 TaxID=3365569 RepID=UPI00371805F8
MRGLRLLRASAALTGCLGVLLLSGGTPAYAHTALKDAAPAPGSTVGTGTRVIALTFSSLKPGTTPQIGLIAGDGTAVPVGRPAMADGTVACASVGALPAGVATLTYTVTAVDDDVQSSAFQFRVSDNAAAVAAPAACKGLSLAAAPAGPSADDEDGTVLGLGRTAAVAVLAAVAALVAGAVLMLRRSRRTRPEGGRHAM